MEDFKSAASAIPPPRHVVRKPNCTKSLLFAVSLAPPTLNARCVEDAGLLHPAFVQIQLPDRGVSLISHCFQDWIAWRAK
jgi:hypothetical protein